MTTKRFTPYPQATACRGGSCHIDRRTVLKGTAALAGGMLISASPRSILAQDGEAPIPVLNCGGMGGGTNPQINFNPYSPNKLVLGFMFEPLYIVDASRCEEHPWLAESYEWTDPQTLVFTIREGVTWSDGEPFDAADVAFTFNMLSENAALDTTGSWNYLSEVTAEGNQVTFSFGEVHTPGFYRVVEVLIVPEHIWSEVDDPVTFVNENPVGTGPFVFENFNPQELTFTRNPDYWQAEQVMIQGLMYSRPGEGQVDQLRLARGEYDWNSMYVPNVEEVFVAEDPEHNHYWYAQGSSISLSFNLTKAPFNDPKFREGVAYAIDRPRIIEQAQLGYVTQASQTGLKLPGQADWLAPEVEDEGMIPFDVEQAKTLLTDAGYTLDGDTLKDPEGNGIEFSFIVPAGWLDWIQAAQIISENLAEIGITMNVETPDAAIHDQDRASGNFDSLFTVHGGQCSMYRNYADHLSSALTKPVGEQAVSNWIRWEDEETDQLLEQLASATEQEAQMEAVHGLQMIQLEQFPTIPLWYGAHWFQYRTEKAVGWPNEENPYTIQAGNSGFLIVINLRPPEE
jgi:peptide/nickel transport system substrate-binding protein